MAPKKQKGSKITLASVLARSDQECLLSELKTLVTETQVTVSSKAEVQAVCEQLQRVVSGAKSWSSITLQLLIHLLKVLPADLTEQLAKVLLDGALLKLIGQAFDKLNRSLQEGASNKQLEHATMVLLQTVEDLSACQYKGPGKQGMVHGKDRCGAVFVKRLVSLATSSVAGVIQRRRCVQLLLELTIRSQSNRELLFNFEEGCNQLFGDVVASCGDYSTQADAMEILYRAAKQDTLKDGGITFQGQPQVKAIFESLVNKSVQDVDATGLTNEVRHLVKAYNASQGSSASVHSFKAAEISIGGSQDIRAVEGNWVDVGKQHLSLAVVVPELEEDAEEPPPDLLDIFYSNIASADAKALPGNDSRHVQLKLRLKETPDILLDHFDANDKSQRLSFTFKKDDLDILLGVIKKVAPSLVKPPAGKPMNDSQDSFFELTQRPQPRVKMSMTMQTLSFRPSTSGVPPSLQKGTLDLHPSTGKAKPSSGTVQQQRSVGKQDHPGVPEAGQTASAAHMIPARHGSSLLPLKDNRQMAHGGEQSPMEGMNDDTAGSPDLDQQVHRPNQRQQGSQLSDSSSDPSEEVLDDPTNIALSQRAPAHLQRGQVLPPHGDPLMAAAHLVEKQPADEHAHVPVKSLPVQQGVWRAKRGSGQSALPHHQMHSASSGLPEQDQRNGPAQSIKAQPQQSQGQDRTQARSSPLYAESEGNESENESSTGGSEAAVEAEQRQLLLEPRQTRASGQASRAALKPPTGRAKDRAAPTAPGNKADLNLPKGRRQLAPVGEDEEVDGFGLFSQDQQEPTRQSKTSRVQPDGEARTGVHTDQAPSAKPAFQGSADAAAKAGERKGVLESQAQGRAADPVLQAAAVEKAAAMHDSANDSEWQAIGQRVPDGRQVQAGCEDLQELPAAGRSEEDEQERSKQLMPERPVPRQSNFLFQSGGEEEVEPAEVPAAARHAPAAAKDSVTKQQATAAAKQQQQLSQAQGHPARRGRQVADREAEGVNNDDVPATYNNMPLQHKHSSQQVSGDDLASDEEDDAGGDSQMASQQQKNTRNQRQQQQHHKQQQPQRVGKDLDFAASDAESDEYEPTQAKAAAKAAAKKAAEKAAQPKDAKGQPRKPKQEKQQAGSNKPHKAAKATAAQGPAKRPRGRPRKAPQEQPSRQQANKRKAAEVTQEEEEEVLPVRAAAKRKAEEFGRLKKAALMPEVSEGEPVQVEEEGQGEEDAMLEDVPPLSREHSPLQFMGRAHKVQPIVPSRAALRLAAADGQHDGAMDFEHEFNAVSFAPVREEEDEGTPAVFAPVAKGGGQRRGQKHADTHRLPFPTSLQVPPAATADAAEDIEVDLGLQQALIQSIRPSPAKAHAKGNALQDISNWRLPMSAKKQRAATGRPSTPLEALAGIAGTKGQQKKATGVPGKAFEVYQDEVKGSKQGTAGPAKKTKPATGRGKAATAQPVLEEPSDSEAEEGAAAGPSIKGVLQHMVSGMTSQDADSDEEGSELADLQRVLQKVVSSKKANARQKQAEIIQAVQHQIDALAADLSKSLKKELHDSGAMCQAQFGDLCNQLADKKAQITTRTEMYQKEVQGLWEGYKETYAKLEPLRQSLALYMQDKSTGHKRKLAELQSEGERMMADAERKLAKTQSRAAKLPALAKMLKAFV